MSRLIKEINWLKCWFIVTVEITSWIFVCVDSNVRFRFFIQIVISWFVVVVIVGIKLIGFWFNIVNCSGWFVIYIKIWSWFCINWYWWVWVIFKVQLWIVVIIVHRSSWIYWLSGRGEASSKWIVIVKINNLFWLIFNKSSLGFIKSKVDDKRWQFNCRFVVLSRWLYVIQLFSWFIVVNSRFWMIFMICIRLLIIEIVMFRWRGLIQDKFELLSVFVPCI